MMKRNARRSDPRYPKVERINLNDEGLRRRAVITVALILVALGVFGYVCYRLLPRADGWKEIEVQSSAAANCGGEFTLRYELGRGGEAATVEYRQVSARYSEAAVDAYRIFHASESFDGCGNLARLNAHPNETVELAPALYEALALLEESGSRLAYLAPVYETAQSLYNCSYDEETLYYDPRLNPELAAEYGRLCAFANDPAAIRVELLGEYRARLTVGADYLRYARENGVTAYLDLFWLRNAFITDYLAEALAAAGHTHGYVASFDGFTRHMDGSGGDFGVRLYERRDGAVYELGTLHYAPPASLALLRAYPGGDPLDTLRYYERQDGELRTPYIDGADGLDRCAVSTLLLRSDTPGCARLALRAAPVYIADTLDTAALRELAGEGIDAAWCAAGEIHTTDPDARIE